MQESQYLRGLARRAWPELDLPGVRRDVGEVCLLGKEASQFDVGVFAFLDLAVQFEEELVLVDDGCIALLHAERAAGDFVAEHFERRPCGFGRAAGQFALCAIAQELASRNQGKQVALETFVRARVAQRAPIREEGKTARRGCRPPGFDGFRRQNLQRQDIRFWQSFGKADIQPEQMRAVRPLGHRHHPAGLDPQDGPSFRAIPAAGWEVSGEDGPLEFTPHDPSQEVMIRRYPFQQRQGAFATFNAFHAGGFQQQPVVAMRTHGDGVRRVLADFRERVLTENFPRLISGVRGQVEFHRLSKPREIHDHEDDLVLVLAQEGQDLVVVGRQKLHCPPAECAITAAGRGDAPCPVQQRGKIPLLIFDIDGFVVVLGINDDRKVKLLRVRPRKTGVAIRAPLHGRAHAVAVAEIDVVAHGDLVAVVDDRRAGQGK